MIMVIIILSSFNRSNFWICESNVGHSDENPGCENFLLEFKSLLTSLFVSDTIPYLAISMGSERSLYLSYQRVNLIHLSTLLAS